MNNPKLIHPSKEYLESYLEACKEYKDKNIIDHFRDPDDFENWRHTIFERFENERNSINLKPGYVPSTTLWLVDDDEFIGSGNIRHFLNDDLKRYGGHIGYGIRVSKWNKGYGTYQLKLLLREASKLGINPALITCHSTNPASAKVMEKNGGKFIDMIDNVRDGQTIKTLRYHVPTDC